MVLCGGLANIYSWNLAVIEGKWQAQDLIICLCPYAFATHEAEWDLAESDFIPSEECQFLSGWKSHSAAKKKSQDVEVILSTYERNRFGNLLAEVCVIVAATAQAKLRVPAGTVTLSQ